MHPFRHTCPYRPVGRRVALMDTYPKVYGDYTLHHFVTKLLKQDRFWAQCERCVYRTRLHADPGHPEHSVSAHLKDVHNIERFPYGAR